MCYAACLFSAKDALKRILPELSVPDNATCENYCEVKVSKYAKSFANICALRLRSSR